MLLVIEITLPKVFEEQVALLLAQHAPAGWEEETRETATLFRIYFKDHYAGHDLACLVAARWPKANVNTHEQEPEDWVMAWKDFFVPVSCGDRFEILPPWLSGSASPQLTPIIIEPKMAFGTGHHPSTALCLECIANLHGNAELAQMTFLDLGTGSGILAIGLAMLGLTGIGLDNDPKAIPCATENAQINKVDNHISFAVGSMDCLAPGLLFDVIVANILSGPLIELAPEIIPHLKRKGCLILSGILTEQAKAVSNAYVALGLDKPETLTENNWATLHFKGMNI